MAELYWVDELLLHCTFVDEQTLGTTRQLAEILPIARVWTAFSMLLIEDITALHESRITQSRVKLLHVRPWHEEVEIVDYIAKRTRQQYQG